MVESGRATLCVVFTAAFLSLVACERRPSSKDAGSTTVSVVCPPADTGVRHTPATSTASLDTLLIAIDKLDRRIGSATEGELPALLLARGRAKIEYQAAGDSQYARYASARPNEFHRYEPDNFWYYNGADFKELIRRFPTSELADDAGYALTLLPQGADCEGDVSCYIQDDWIRISQFLRAFPTSPFGDSAVGRAIGAFHSLDPVLDLRAVDEGYDPKAVRPLVASLDTIGRLLPPPRSTRLLMRAAQLWDLFGDNELARSAYRQAMVGAPADLRACIDARLAAVPAQSFTLELVRVIHPRRVELHWQAPSSATKAFVVYRSDARADTGMSVARISGTVLTWTDTTTQPGTAYWYHVGAQTTTGTALSTPASATTPALTIYPVSIAVSTADRHLYVFGSLANGYPQTLKVTEDGARIERLDGEIVGANARIVRRFPMGGYLEDVWLADATGRGVMHLHKTDGKLSPDVLRLLRRGGELLRADAITTSDRPLVSIDELARAAWLERGEAGLPTGMDCVSGPSICWLALENRIVLRTDAGDTLTAVPLPRTEHEGEPSWAAAIFADPRDSSAWVFHRNSGRLLVVDRAGRFRHDVQIVGPNQWYSVVLTADRDRRILWFTRPGASRHTELAQIDFNVAEPHVGVVASDVPSPLRLAPDLNGGVWLLTDTDVRRIDGRGRTMFTVAIKRR